MRENYVIAVIVIILLLLLALASFVIWHIRKRMHEANEYEDEEAG